MQDGMLSQKEVNENSSLGFDFCRSVNGPRTPTRHFLRPQHFLLALQEGSGQGSNSHDGLKLPLC